MPRLFTGLELPDRLARDLMSVRGGLFGARWIEPEDYHITLRFIGDIGGGGRRRGAFDPRAHPASALQRDAHGPSRPFGGDRPRAVVALVKPVPALVELQAEHERLMRRLGLQAETRKFTPHVTLARLRQTSPAEVANFLSCRGFLATHDIPVDHFALFSARDSVGGGPYVAEAVYPLR